MINTNAKYILDRVSLRREIDSQGEDVRDVIEDGRVEIKRDSARADETIFRRARGCLARERRDGEEGE